MLRGSILVAYIFCLAPLISGAQLLPIKPGAPQFKWRIGQERSWQLPELNRTEIQVHGNRHHHRFGVNLSRQGSRFLNQNSLGGYAAWGWDTLSFVGIGATYHLWQSPVAETTHRSNIAGLFITQWPISDMLIFRTDFHLNSRLEFGVISTWSAHFHISPPLWLAVQLQTNDRLPTQLMLSGNYWITRRHQLSIHLKLPRSLLAIGIVMHWRSIKLFMGFEYRKDAQLWQGVSIGQ